MPKIHFNYKELDILERGIHALIKKDRWGNECYALEVFTKIQQHKVKAREKLREIQDINYKIEHLQAQLIELEEADNA
jgi:hypothetical protein